ncbi:Uncharacterised protein [Chlamydia trachomatis]|nr:Uncharacterised protein [Chlamydia trachomatis]
MPEAILANNASSNIIAPIADIDLTSCGMLYPVNGSSVFTRISIDSAIPIKGPVFTPFRLIFDISLATTTNSAITALIAITAGANFPVSIPLRTRKDIANNTNEEAIAIIVGMLASACFNPPPVFILDNALVAKTISPSPKPNAVSPLARLTISIPDNINKEAANTPNAIAICIITLDLT